MTTTNTFADFDSVMDAQMNDLDDLPPIGVPPTGHYNLRVSAERKQNQDKTSEYVQFSYVVEAINEIKNAEEESQAAVDQKFSNNFSPLKKDGTVNEFGIGFLKEAVAPFSAHFGSAGLGETLGLIKDVSVAATLVRRANKKEEGRFDFNLKDVVVL